MDESVGPQISAGLRPVLGHLAAKGPTLCPKQQFESSQVPQKAGSNTLIGPGQPGSGSQSIPSGYPKQNGEMKTASAELALTRPNGTATINFSDLNGNGDVLLMPGAVEPGNRDCTCPPDNNAAQGQKMGPGLDLLGLSPSRQSSSLSDLPNQIGSAPSSSTTGSMAASQLTTLLLRINSKLPPSLEHFQASMVDYKEGGGVFYEKRVDRIIVFDESKKALFAIPVVGRDKKEPKLPSQRGPEGEPVPKVAAQAVSQWQKRCRTRRLQKRREMIERGTMRTPTGGGSGGANGNGNNAGMAARRSQLRRCQSSASMLPNSDHVATVVGQSQVPKPRPPLIRAASETAMINQRKPMLPLVPPPMKDSDTDIEEKILRRKEMSHLFQWYYPEGGWGWVVLVSACLSRALSQGFQWSFAYPLAQLIQTQFGDEDKPIGPIKMGALAATSLAVSQLVSPVVVTLCQTRSTRLMAVVGGLVMALGVLFTSFAQEFHQLFFSFGLVIGLGVAMIRDSGTIMIGHYFRKRRPLVEVLYVSSPGWGIGLMSFCLQHLTKVHSWRVSLQIIAGLMSSIFILGTFFRSASLYHPQRRAILHLKGLKRRITIRNGHGSGSEILPWTQLTAHKRISIQMIFLSYCIASVGIYHPLVYLNQFEETQSDRGFEAEEIRGNALNHQVLLGLGLIFGSILSGYLAIKKAKDCFIGKIYLCQAVFCLLSFTLFGLAFPRNHLGHCLLIVIYGTIPTALTFTTKTYIHERVKTRDFGQVWSLLQALSAFPIGVGIPLLAWVNQESSHSLGHLLGSILALLACLILVIGHNCSKNRQSYGSTTIRHKKVQVNMAKADFSRPSTPGYDTDFCDDEVEEYEDDYEFEDEYVIEPGYEDTKNFLADDNITSCNKVENVLMYSELEQNLSKESEDKSISSTSSSSQNHTRTNGKFSRLWTLRRQSTEDFSLSDRSSSSNGARESTKLIKDPKEMPRFTNTANRAAKASNPLRKQRSITVIEEVSTS